MSGCVHNSQVIEWGGISTKLQRVYEKTGTWCTVDSMFVKTCYPFLIKSGQDDTNIMEDNIAEIWDGIQLENEATSMRQSPEWGIHTLKPYFPH